MPRVTSQPSRATSTATARLRRNAAGVGDDVVGGERAHHRVGVAALEHRGGQADRGHRVAGGRLGDDRVVAEVGQLGGDGVAVGRAGHDQHPVLDQRGQPVEGALHQRAAGAGEVVEELRRRDRDSGQSRVPAPPAGTTAQKCSIGPVRHGRSLRCPRDHVRGVLDGRARRDPGRPLVTWYDDATGERVELSVATYANWVAKTASLLVEEHDLERGDSAAGRPAAALAGPGVPRRRLDAPGWWSSDDRRRRTPWCAAPTGSAAGRRRRGPAGARLLAAAAWASGSPSRCRPASTTSASRSGRSRTRSRRTTRPSRRRRGERPRRRAPHPARAVERGRRRESPHRRRPPPRLRRTRLPHRGSPPSPSRSRGGGSLVLVARPTRSGSRRRTSPSAPRRASLPERPGLS